MSFGISLILCAAIFGAGATEGSNATAPASFKLDDQHTSIVFAVDHFGFSYTYGMFGEYEGAFSFDKDNPTASQFEFSIKANSLDTKSEKRDEHLRGPDFFNVKQFPLITFKSKQVSIEDKKINVLGDLTMHGVTKEVVMPLSYVGEGKGPYGAERLGFYGTFTVKRTEFGITTFAPKVGDEVRIVLSFEGIKQ